MKTACPNCRHVYKIPDDALGKRVKCKKCDTAFVIEPYEDEAVERTAVEPVTEPPPLPPKPEHQLPEETGEFMPAMDEEIRHALEHIYQQGEN